LAKKAHFTRQRRARAPGMSRMQGQRMADPNYKVNFPPDPNPRPPRFAVPAGSWDSHFHVLAPHLFPYLEKRRYTPPAAPLEHYLAIASALGLDRGCVVQSSFSATAGLRRS
jgi:hypothetical protein